MSADIEKDPAMLASRVLSASMAEIGSIIDDAIYKKTGARCAFVLVAKPSIEGPKLCSAVSNMLQPANVAALLLEAAEVQNSLVPPKGGLHS